ncbi:imidazolonepropionase-like amidohydrolase [Actinomadura pelletieri DSM 43383]|uniref:Imidazolonepropionase-like amidohydrolase n=1 Tax=Actinomadura pelletieri DSM 43383 TaxID=1120940 RepID=A0A495QXJ5_9ACTN|nr:amidohydrolase family protein [Actinomadura pelletieri]RKS78840.1 imidazolonepropionase-like amidohydrolase [Actinomadura pelletieri DSM 43383]
MSKLAIGVTRVFDGERLLDEPALILVENGRIAGIQPGTEAPDDWTTRHYDGTALPGLIDTHVHLCANGDLGALENIEHLSPKDLHDTIETSLHLHLAAGVTTVRDLGDHQDAVLEWRTHDKPGLPTVVASGTPITSMDGHCASLGGQARGEAEIRAMVRRRAEHGADIVKIMASGGVLTPGTDTLSPQFTEPEMRAAVDEAHRLGLPITAHAHALDAVRQALAAGVDGIEHCTCLTSDGVRADDALLTKLAESGTTVCPTLGSDPAVVVPPEIIAVAARAGITEAVLQETAMRLHKGGARLVAGSDGGIGPAKPHGLLPYTLEEYVHAGLPATAALRAATSVAAEACGLPAHKGRIRTAHDADLLIVTGDPTTDITALHTPQATYLSGHLQ